MQQHDEEMVARGKRVLVGAALLTIGGLIGLLGMMYGPYDARTADGQLAVRDGAERMAALGAVVTVVFGVSAAWVLRPQVALMVCAAAVAAVGTANLLEVLPAL